MSSSALSALAKLAGLAIAAYVAWEARKKKEYVEQLAETQIQSHIPLRAAMESEGTKGTVRQYATIEKRKDAYYLEIRNDTEHGPLEIADTFENVDALESYLTANTKFRFGDFIAR